MISNVITITNGKGGALKTSLATSLAGLAAAGGWRTLLVDLDPQGDCQTNLGYTDRTDRGRSMATALTGGGVPDVLAEVRPNLDVVCGGDELASAVSHLRNEAARGVYALNRLEQALGPLAVNYNLVVLDLPPQFDFLHSAAFSMTHYIVIPTQPDRASINGFAKVLTTLLDARSTTNPHLELLAAVCGPVPKSATAQWRDVSARIADILGYDDILVDTPVRASATAAELCRDLGLLPHELEEREQAEEQANPFWKALREGRRQARRKAANPGGLAEDYRQIVTEILRRFTQRQSELAASATVDLRGRPAAPLEEGSNL